MLRHQIPTIFLLFVFLLLATVGCDAAGPAGSTPIAAATWTPPLPSPTLAQTTEEPTAAVSTPIPPATTIPTAQPSRPAPETSDAIDRQTDPVVLTGDSIPSLLGLPVDAVVGWRYDGAWEQIPIQVDERAMISLPFVLKRSEVTDDLVILFYSDPNTRVGPDLDPAFDADDELVFMARDAGMRAETADRPSGVIPGTIVELVLDDPVLGGPPGYVYLFEQDGSLDPSAGQQYVVYEYPGQPVTSADATQQADNPKGPGGGVVAVRSGDEAIVSTPYYRQHFATDWVTDELFLYTGSADEVDLLDRLRSQLVPDNCERSEDTFSQGNSNYLVNKAGPIRALRSFMGANSGVYTQRLHIFYERHQQVVTYTRVHKVGGAMDFIDYSSAAIGMTYFNDLNLDGALIDGQPDDVIAGPLAWEMVTGDQGSLIMPYVVDTNIPDLVFSSYYVDNSAPPIAPCAGDDVYYGASGVFLSPLPCTDPGRALIDQRNCATAYRLESSRYIYYELPNRSVTDAQLRYELFQTPIRVTVSASQP